MGPSARWSAPNVFLNEPGKVEVSPGRARAGERRRERGIRGEEAGLDRHPGGRARQGTRHPGRGDRRCGYREVEQAVFATFLHSQPVGQKASQRDLMVLLGADAARQDRAGEGAEPLDRHVVVPGRGEFSTARRSADGEAGLPEVVAAGVEAEPHPDAPRCLHARVAPTWSRRSSSTTSRSSRR